MRFSTKHSDTCVWITWIEKTSHFDINIIGCVDLIRKYVVFGKFMKFLEALICSYLFGFIYGMNCDTSKHKYANTLSRGKHWKQDERKNLGATKTKEKKRRNNKPDTTKHKIVTDFSTYKNVAQTFVFFPNYS